MQKPYFCVDSFAQSAIIDYPNLDVAIFTPKSYIDRWQRWETTYDMDVYITQPVGKLNVDLPEVKHNTMVNISDKRGVKQ